MRPLELSGDEFRRLAAEVAELSAEYLSTLDERSTFPRTSGAEAERLFGLELPRKGMGKQALGGLRAERTLLRVCARAGRGSGGAGRSVRVDP
jgi:hypothetical protein